MFTRAYAHIYTHARNNMHRLAELAMTHTQTRTQHTTRIQAHTHRLAELAMTRTQTHRMAELAV